MISSPDDRVVALAICCAWIEASARPSWWRWTSYLAWAIPMGSRGGVA